MPKLSHLSSMTKPHRITADQPVLIVEDSRDDYLATVRAFRKVGLKNPIYHAQTGETAMRFLVEHLHAVAPAGLPAPGLVLLDLNLPGLDGRDLLEQLKRDRDLKTIPVVVLTSSFDDRDVERCYRAGANSYVRKPVDSAKFLDLVRRIKEFWFDLAVLPRRDADQ